MSDVHVRGAQHIDRSITYVVWVDHMSLKKQLLAYHLSLLWHLALD